MAEKKAVVLLSGGMDSATCLYCAKNAGYALYALGFEYGQTHTREIESARKVAEICGAGFELIKIGLPWKGSALIDENIGIPEFPSEGIPPTYVPARNIIFLSYALSYAETIGAKAVFLGVHSQDYSGYPDCRACFIDAFSRMKDEGLKDGRKIEIIAPLLEMKKTDIIRLGRELGVPFELTWSCYRGGSVPCRRCDSCFYRERAFEALGLKDPLYERSQDLGNIPVVSR